MSEYYMLPRAIGDDRFPRHGWARGDSGILHLRFPLLRLFQFEEPWHRRFSDLKLAGTWLQSRGPYAPLRMLAVALRDLSSELRAILPGLEHEWLDRPPSQERNDFMTGHHEAIERSEILLMAAFVLLRRLADQIIDSTRPLLFEDWHSAPRQMKTAISSAKAGSLDSLDPRCDIAILHSALLNKTKWFDALRQDEGVRDILVHKDHVFNVSGLGTKAKLEKDWSWRVTAHLTRFRREGVWSVDVIPVLKSCLEGLCDFMEDVYRCLSTRGSYERGDVLFLTGRDDDSTALWPGIER